MLTKNPEIGETIIALHDGYWIESWEDQYQTIGKAYKVVGKSDVSGNPYFIDDTGQATYIDNSAWFMYELVDGGKTEDDTKITLVGTEVDRETSDKKSTDFLFRFEVIQEGENVLQSIGEFEMEVEKLLKNRGE